MTLEWNPKDCRTLCVVSRGTERDRESLASAELGWRLYLWAAARRPLGFSANLARETITVGFIDGV